MATAAWLWENVVEWRARDNAAETDPCEGYTHEDKMNHTAAWAQQVWASASSIIDSLTSERECVGYGVTKPIPSRTVKALEKLLKEHYGYAYGRGVQKVCEHCGAESCGKREWDVCRTVANASQRQRSLKGGK